MELILFRHGAAEPRGSRNNDGERELTDKGIRKVTVAAKTLRSVIAETDPVVIWSSPLVRAVQTARIISETLNLGEPNLFDFIASGSFRELGEQLLTLPEPACVIIVGHAPTLDEWLTEMTGGRVKLGKGGAAGFTILGNTPLEAKMTWLIQPAGWDRFS